MQTSVELVEPMIPAKAASSSSTTTTAPANTTKRNPIQQKAADQSVVLPLTPPYTASNNEISPHKRSNSSPHYNPYKRPTTTLKKRKLGLVSPKDK